MFIEASISRQGDNAILKSPLLSFNGQMCLNFFYHMYGLYGQNVGTLRVIINGTKTVFSESGDTGNQWRAAWKDISFTGMAMVSNISG